MAAKGPPPAGGLTLFLVCAGNRVLPAIDLASDQSFITPPPVAIVRYQRGMSAMAIAFHMIWRDQIQAVSAIRQRHGEAAAFDYIVDEKLMNFAEAAEGRPAFARELPVSSPRFARSFLLLRCGPGYSALPIILKRIRPALPECSTRNKATPLAKASMMATGTATPTTILKMRKRSRDECSPFRRDKCASNFCVTCSSLSGSAQPEAAYLAAGTVSKLMSHAAREQPGKGRPAVPAVFADPARPYLRAGWRVVQTGETRERRRSRAVVARCLPGDRTFCTPPQVQLEAAR